MIKAVFFDIDGTLVSFKTHEISENTLNVLYELKRRGIRLYISSGRHRLIMDNLSGFPFDGYVCMNGALVIDDGQVVYGHPLDPADAATVADFAERNRIPCVLFAEKDIVMNCHNELTDQVFKMIRLPKPLPSPLAPYLDKPVYQFTIFINRETEAGLLPSLGHSVAERWHPEFTDIDPENISKAEGISKVIARHGIAREEVMAIGDGGNDISMIRYAGIGVAMGNAADDVKMHADYVTSDVDEDGVVAAVRHFGLLD